MTNQQNRDDQGRFTHDGNRGSSGGRYASGGRYDESYGRSQAAGALLRMRTIAIAMNMGASLATTVTVTVAKNTAKAAGTVIQNVIQKQPAMVTSLRSARSRKQ